MNEVERAELLELVQRTRRMIAGNTLSALWDVVQDAEAHLTPSKYCNPVMSVSECIRCLREAAERHHWN